MFGIEEDEDEEEQQQEDLSPEARQSVQESVLARYREASDPAHMRKVEAQASRENSINDVLGAFGNYGRNELAARGLKTENDPFWDQRKKEVQDRVMRARQTQKDQLENIKTEDQLGWQEKERGRKEQEWKDSDEVRTAERDANSSQSELARSVAKKMDPKGNYDGMSAFQLKQSLPHLEKIYEAEQRRLGRIDTLNFQRDMKAEARQAREDEKTAKAEKALEELKVGDYGTARNADDAKKLKSAVELKDSFDRKLEEMIALRKSHGAEVMDREAVERGKQLSRDLLLAYKDMAKLGVLSKSDESILNQIIPADPLEWNSASLMGQDPTMVRMKKFKDDTNADFDSSLGLRLREKGPAAIAREKQRSPSGGSSGSFGEATAAPAGKTVVKKQFSPSRNKTKIVYSDGTEELVDGQK